VHVIERRQRDRGMQPGTLNPRRTWMPPLRSSPWEARHPDCTSSLTCSSTCGATPSPADERPLCRPYINEGFSRRHQTDGVQWQQSQQQQYQASKSRVIHRKAASCLAAGMTCSPRTFAVLRLWRDASSRIADTSASYCTRQAASSASLSVLLGSTRGATPCKHTCPTISTSLLAGSRPPKCPGAQTADMLQYHAQCIPVMGCASVISHY
jgi:hypothetical protein